MDPALERLIDKILQPIDYAAIAAHEAARTDPWVYYCRLCGQRESIPHGIGAQEERDALARLHLATTRCGRGRSIGWETSGRLLHVWTYGVVYDFPS